MKGYQPRGILPICTRFIVERCTSLEGKTGRLCSSCRYRGPRRVACCPTRTTPGRDCVRYITTTDRPGHLFEGADKKTDYLFRLPLKPRLVGPGCLKVWTDGGTSVLLDLCSRHPICYFQTSAQDS